MLACLQHRAAAGWRCTRCERVLCPACAAPSSGLVVCTHCGALADVIRERRAVLRPFREQVLPALWWPLQREGVFCCAAAAVVLWALGAMGGLGGLIADGIVLAYLFQIVRHTARGGDDFPAPGDFRGFFEDVVGPLFRILLASVWLLGPAMMWAFWSAQGDMARYLESNVLASRSLPVLALLALCAFVLLFVPVAMFRAIGLFVRTFGDVLGYGMASDYLDPVLGAALPRGKVPEIRAPQKPPPPDAIEI